MLLTAKTCSYHSFVETSRGTITLQGDGEFLTGLYWPGHKHWSGTPADSRQADEPFAHVREQLAQYFAGTRQNFDVPLRMHGTEFQQRVWQILAEIPFGTTITYAELARRIGNTNASRAVGSANGRNPISLLIPCHRVIGGHGKLTGYAGGIDVKERLLVWEQTVLGRREKLLPGMLNTTELLAI